MSDVNLDATIDALSDLADSALVSFGPVIAIVIAFFAIRWGLSYLLALFSDVNSDRRDRDDKIEEDAKHDDPFR